MNFIFLFNEVPKAGIRFDVNYFFLIRGGADYTKRKKKKNEKLHPKTVYKIFNK